METKKIIWPLLFAAIIVNPPVANCAITYESESIEESYDMASRRYSDKILKLFNHGSVRLLRADGRKLWYIYKDGKYYDTKLYVYNSETNRTKLVNLNKTTLESIWITDLVETNGKITIIMEENRNSNGWVIGTYVWQYNCSTGQWTPLAKACSGAEFINNHTAVKINNAECINPGDPTYLQRYIDHYKIIKIG